MAPVLVLVTKFGTAFVGALCCSSPLFGTATHAGQLSTANSAARASLRAAESESHLGAKDVTDGIYDHSSSIMSPVAACLLIHNKYRTENLQVPLPAMSRNADAVALVMEFVEKRAVGKCKVQGHSTESQAKEMGENLYMSNNPTCEAAVTAWYDEIQYFDGNYPGTEWSNMKEPVGHFTQVMWTKSTGLGCARTIGCEGWNQLFCVYQPAGNYLGQAPFSEEVWKAIKKRDGISGAMALAPVSTVAVAVATSALVYVLVA
ncbi:SCP family extracellular subfamily protein [Besnoitia besnoiti]|uniref:SCP family extracellular subfamily protein n=1 Tax=Besnoitia besnoiti TaxID=94643 RepID=A0A2A9M912_BESBE|nr:SCP family extracellular subfamily protein [Besnoitia besnoiti]PFH32386.1 SCP family extracellular subfamily protein [Besnoitia besnoiti]